MPEILSCKSPKYGFQVSYYNHDEYIGRHAPSDNIEPVVSKLFYSRVQEGDIVADIGANLGWYSLLAASKGAKVWALEPERDNFKLLLRNIKDNEFGDYVIPLQAAAGKLNDKVEVYINEANLGDHRVYNFKKSDEKANYWVKQIPLTDLPAIPTVVKMDTQGYEWEIIQGMDFTHRPDLFTEYSPNMKFFKPHKKDFFYKLLDIYGCAYIIDDKKDKAYRVHNHSTVEQLINRWKHDHANLFYPREGVECDDFIEI